MYYSYVVCRGDGWLFHLGVSFPWLLVGYGVEVSLCGINSSQLGLGVWPASRGWGGGHSGDVLVQAHQNGHPITNWDPRAAVVPTPRARPESLARQTARQARSFPSHGWEDREGYQMRRMPWDSLAVSHPPKLV